MPSYDYFLERETDHYHLVAVGTSREDAFVTFQSKATGVLIPHMSPKLADPHADMEGADWWVTYLEQAEALEGEALDKHLSRFVPITRLSEMDITRLEAYSAQKNSADEQAYVTLATLANTEDSSKGLPLARKVDSAIEVVKRYRDTLNAGSIKDTVTALASDLSSLRHTLQNEIASGKAKSHDFEYFEIGSRINMLGLLRDDVLSYADEVILQDVLASLHNAKAHYQIGRRQVELSHADRLPVLPADHPYHQGIKRMAMGESPLVPDETLIASGWFGGEDRAGAHATQYSPSGALNAPMYETAPSTRFRDYRKGGAALGLTLLGRCQSAEEKRNLFQLMQAMRFDTGMLYMQDRKDLSQLTNGKPISELLWDLQVSGVNDNSRTLEFDRHKFGKKETQLLIHNMQAINHIYWHGLEGEIKTTHGDTLRITPYSREEIISTGESGKMRLLEIDPGLQGEDKANARTKSQYAEISYFDKDGQHVFSGSFDIEQLGFIEDPKIAMVLMDLPPGIFTRPEHLFAVEAASNNFSLKTSLAEGALKLRDNQIKQSHLYNGPWKSMVARIDREIDKHPNIEGSYIRTKNSMTANKTLEPYQKGTHIRDMEKMLDKVLNAVKTSYLVEAESPYSDLDELLDDHEDESHVIKIHGETFSLNQEDSQGLYQDLFYNARLDLAERAHHDYSHVRSAASPDVALTWEPALPEITLEVPGQSPITITNLCSYTDITLEGDAMSHCLGSYARRCIQGDYLAFSVMQDGKRVGTLGMEADGDSATFDQLQGYGNGPIDSVIHDVVMKKFVTPLEEDGEVMEEELEICTPDAYENRLTNRQLLSLQMDFELFDDEKQKICRDYLTSLVSTESVVAMIEREMDRQHDMYMAYEIEEDMPDFFHYERAKLEENRDKLYRDFGLSRHVAMDMTAS